MKRQKKPDTMVIEGRTDSCRRVVLIAKKGLPGSVLREMLEREGATHDFRYTLISCKGITTGRGEL